MNLLLWRNYGVNSQVHLFHRYNIFLYIFKLKKKTSGKQWTEVYWLMICFGTAHYILG